MRSKKYRSSLVKGILIILAHVMVIVMACIMGWILAYPSVGMEAFRSKPAKEYQDSVGFQELMNSYSYHVAEKVQAKQLFETNGEVDKDRLIDIETFEAERDFLQDEGEYEEAPEEPKESEKLQYRLGDLLGWYDKIDEGEEGNVYRDESIIVCQKTDGSYYYYKLPEFYDLFEKGDLRFILASVDNEAATKEQILWELEQGYDISDHAFRGIQDADGKTVYVDCWLYSGDWIKEKYAPAGQGSILEFVNQNEKWNGRLEDVYPMLRNAIYSIGSDYELYQSDLYGLEEGNTNYTYLYVDQKNKKVYTNRAEYQDYGNVEKNVESLKGLGKYMLIRPRLGEFETNMNFNIERWFMEIEGSISNQEEYIFAAAVDVTYPIKDQFYAENEAFEKYGANGRELLMLAILALLIFLACTVWLVVVAGRSDQDEELHLHWFDRWYTEIAAALVIGLGIIVMLPGGMMISGGIEIMRRIMYRVDGSQIQDINYVRDSIPYMAGFTALAVVLCTLFLIGLLSLVRRIKARTLWKNSLFRKICRFVGVIFDNLNSVWKVVVFFAGFVLIQFVMLGAYGVIYSGTYYLIVFGAEIFGFVWLVYQSIGRKKLKDGIHRISQGELDYKISLGVLRGEQRQMAEDINSIGAGLDAAVEKSMKSERLKTDLITNVSHDIKTPLTSIINYVELLKQENFEDPKIQHYIEVLEQKSQRLKTLTEDIVEASKVSSGNITLEYMNLNLAEMIQQTSGEFEEKFTKRGLKEVLTFPKEEAIIWADGRRTWRILENIYNNAAKYAMEGTRVYGDLAVDEQTVTFSLKNMSEQPLNISADELTERFIRGDVSRSTEGSGLGLSIAKSLAQMQGGTFELYLDGDLFRVTITFPRVK